MKASVVLLLLPSLLVAQRIQRPAQPASAVTGPIVPAAIWQPLPVMPVPLSLSPNGRIAFKSGGDFHALGRVGGQWRIWWLVKRCVQFNPSSSPLCSWDVKSSSDLPVGVEVRALVNLAGPEPNRLYKFQEIGTLVSPPGPGQYQLYPSKGVTVPLANGQVLMGQQSNWGVVSWWLQTGNDNWKQLSGGPLLTDASRRVFLLTELGEHRPDNWGISASVLADLK